jgi:tRNA pseudouridine32 synthase/23S rRNA pseudouridine746 synthase
MTGLVTYFAPQPDARELPACLPSPFAGEPHPVARRAADHLRARLEGAEPTWAAAVARHPRGKMFGVLVVAGGDGRVGYLSGFSGMIDGSWRLGGFVEPIFDLERREATWPAGEAQIVAFDEAIAALAGPETEARAALAAADAAHAGAAAALAAVHAENRRSRHARRAAATDGATLHALAQESRADLAARRRLRAAQQAQRRPFVEALRTVEERRRALERARVARSCELLEVLYAGYQIHSAGGQRRSLRDLFAPATPPGGSGDCAAPKLIAHALRAALRPIALAEFWVGAPLVASDRRAGVYYPACREKCGPVLAHMLDGLDARFAT